MSGKARRNRNHQVSATVAWVAHSVGISIRHQVGLGSPQLPLTFLLTSGYSKNFTQIDLSD
jgi:hypothetical protein